MNVRRPAAVLATVALSCSLSACGLFSGSSDETKKDDAPQNAVSAKASTCAKQTLEQLGRPERVGQLLMVGVPIGETSAAADLVTKDHLGGVLLNGVASTTIARQKAAIRPVVEAAGDGPRPYVAVFQEGGAVQSLTGRDFPSLPAADAQGKWKPQQTIDQVAASAKALRATGVNLTLSPVSDTVMTKTVAANAPVGAKKRSFGTDPDLVATQVHLTVQAFQSQGVGTALKHFPGLGRLTTNPATDAKAADDDLTADDEQLVPFTTGIGAGAKLVMMSPATYPKLDADHPAVFSSKIIEGLLRKKLGFTGIVVSYDLGGTATVADVDAADRGVDFIEAGGDLALVQNSTKVAATVLDGMLAKDKASADFRTRVDEAALRVLAVKAEQGVISCS